MEVITNMKIGARLGFGFSLVLSLMGVMTALGLWRLGAVAAGTEAIVSYAKNDQLSREWLKGIAVNATRTVAIAKSMDPEARKFFQDQVAEQSGQISRIQQELESRITDADGKQALSKVADMRKVYLDVRNAVFKLQKDGGDPSTVRDLVDGKMIPALNAYVQAVQDVVDHQKSLLENSNQSVQAIEKSGRQLLIALGLAALAAGVTFAWALSRSISRPLTEAVRIARTVASGDLTSRIEVKSQDETGQLLQALKEMNESLIRLVRQVRSGTETIVTASTQISAGNLDLSARTEQQASSLEETASSMEELTSTVKQNADNARQANQLAVTASDVAIQGGVVVADVVHTMGEINESSRKIVDIITVIDGIAFQTNILALNAAVEAARAGEQGRGFAVVAAEVRTLAQRAAGAAKEIKDLINHSVEKTEAGMGLANQAGSTMDEVVASVRRVTDIMGGISAASQEQTAGIEQVNGAIGQMDQVTQQNAALVEEAAAAAQSLQDQAVRLSEMVNSFKLDIVRNTIPASLPKQQGRPQPCVESS